MSHLNWAKFEMGTTEHRKTAAKRVTAAVVTVSTSRTIIDDESGLWIVKALEKEGHKVLLHRVVTDDEAAISRVLAEALALDPGVVLMNGGTGITPTDVTIEAVSPLFDKHLPAFSALFAQLSFDQIDAAAVLSRATAGLIGKSLVFCMPGSKKAVKLAMEGLILPEIAHFVSHARG